MTIFEVIGGRITHQYLMRKSKSELAYMVLDYLNEIERRSWIDCTDRLPNKSGVYLVSLESDGEYEFDIDVASFSEPRQRWEKRAVVYGWQPLPAPYRPDYWNPTANVANTLGVRPEPSQGEAAGIRSAGPADTRESEKRPGHKRYGEFEQVNGGVVNDLLDAKRKLEDGLIELMTGNYEEATKEAVKRVVADMYPPICQKHKSKFKNLRERNEDMGDEY